MPKIKPLESISNLNLEIQSAIQAIPVCDRYFITLSGGIDSVALTYFCLPYLRLHTKNIHVIHINHGLSPNADAWSEFCQTFCDQLGVACHIEKVHVVSEGKGLEAAARKARYEVFSRYLSEGGVLLQGHHLNDQAETVLMRVFKGLGPESIRGIPKLRTLSQGIIYRPFLGLERALIGAEVNLSKLSWVDDESNLDVRFERNYLRHDVLPLLSKRRPGILRDLERTAKKSQESVEFIQEWCAANQKKFLSLAYSQYKAIDLSRLACFSVLQQKFIIRFWLDLLGVSHPGEASFQRIFDELVVAQSDSQAEVCWNNNVLRVFDNSMFCLSSLLSSQLNVDGYVSAKIMIAEIRGQLCLKLPSGRLSIYIENVDEINPNHLGEQKASCDSVFDMVCALPESVNELTIKFRSGGEKIYLHQKNSTSLKKLYQTKKVLPWLRDKLPLIYSKEELLCSLAGFVAAPFKAEEYEKNHCHTSKQRIHFRFELS